MSGRQLGHYDILEPLGAGGMGEVYRARDKRLKRDVAIKVLPEDLADDPERMARLEREAHLLAALNHPSIATVYSLEKANGRRFLVMELVRGRSLETLIAEGGLPLDEALDVCRQIAEALEAAHEQGIIHRDLKPANVIVSPAGKAKVLDFGLAKTVEREYHDGALSHSPTVTVAGTQAGVILGTAPYMSPEQVRGKRLDERADIWAFGCVLFECVTGTKAFDRETVADTLAAILDAEPPWQHLPTATPAAVRQLLGRCLRKKPERRLHHIADARIEIEEALEPPAGLPFRGGAVPGVADDAIVWGRGTRAVAVLMVAAAAAVGGLAVWIASRPEPPRAETWDITMPGSFRNEIAISPDGSRIVFSSDDQLWVRNTDTPAAEPIPFTAGGRHPFFSPNGEHVGYSTSGRIELVGFEGAAPTVVTGMGMGSASWGEDQLIYFSRGRDGIWRVPAQAGAEAEQIITMGESEWAFGPQLLPGGEWVLYSVSRVRNFWRDADIVARSLVTDETRRLVEGGVAGRYVPTGHIVYLYQGTLFAVPFDVRALETTSTAVAVVEGVAHSQSLVMPGYALSEGGRLVYRPGGIHVQEDPLVWIDRDGRTERLPFEPREFFTPRLSPDGKYIAVAVYDDSQADVERRDLWIYEINGGAPFRLSDGPFAGHPVWSPDSRFVYYSCCLRGEADIWKASVDRSEPPQRVFAAEGSQNARSISADGKLLLFWSGDSTPFSCWRLSLEGDPESERLTDPGKNADLPSISPDGRYFAFQSDDDSESMQIYVRQISGTRRWTVSTAGGSMPVWSPDGTEIFYISEEKLYAVDVETRPQFALLSAPRPVHDHGGPDWNDYGVAADGQRFLQRGLKEPPELLLHVVTNWFDELERRVPAQR